MRRMTTTDGGSRYLATFPFARDVPTDEREAIHEALAAASFERSHRLTDDPIDTRDVDVTAESARVTVALDIGDDHNPADVLGKLNAAIGEWHRREGPLAEPTRKGGAQSIASLDAAGLGIDRDPEDVDAGPHTYLLAYPDRRLTDDEVALFEHVTDEAAVVTPSFIALTDALSVVRSRPADRALRELRTDLRSHLPDDHDLRQRGAFPTREVGTLAAVDEAALEALRRRGRQQTPHTPEDATTAEADI